MSGGQNSNWDIPINGLSLSTHQNLVFIVRQVTLKKISLLTTRWEEQELAKSTFFYSGGRILLGENSYIKQAHTSLKLN